MDVDIHGVTSLTVTTLNEFPPDRFHNVTWYSAKLTAKSDKEEVNLTLYLDRKPLLLWEGKDLLNLEHAEPATDD